MFETEFLEGQWVFDMMMVKMITKMRSFLGRGAVYKASQP